MIYFFVGCIAALIAFIIVSAISSVVKDNTYLIELSRYGTFHVDKGLRHRRTEIIRDLKEKNYVHKVKWKLKYMGNHIHSPHTIHIPQYTHHRIHTRITRTHHTVHT